jgi:hypothetical protein
MPEQRITSAGTKERWLTSEKLVVAIIVPIAVVLLGAALTWWTNRPTTDVEVVDLTVVEGEVVEGQQPGELGIVPPRIQVALRNLGDQVSVVTGAQLKILDHAFLAICEAGGALMVSQTYDVLLPLDPTPNEVVGVDVVQELQPNQADRFEFSLQTPQPEEVFATGTHLYRIGVSLIRDGNAETLDAGVAIVGAPVLNVDIDSIGVTADLLESPDEVGACYRNFRFEYQRVQGWEGQRSPQLAAAPDDILVD